MVFCNIGVILTNKRDKKITILILVDGFLQYRPVAFVGFLKNITILILVDGFLQFMKIVSDRECDRSQSLF